MSHISTRRKSTLSSIGESPLIRSLDLNAPNTPNTPKVVLKERLAVKDNIIKKLSEEFKELQEFTRLEAEVLEEEKKTIEKNAVKGEARYNTCTEFMKFVTVSSSFLGMRQSMAQVSSEKGYLEHTIDSLKEQLSKANQDLRFVQEENSRLWNEKYENEKIQRRKSELLQARVRIL